MTTYRDSISDSMQKNPIDYVRYQIFHKEASGSDLAQISEMQETTLIIWQRGHSTTTWTQFYPAVTTYPPRVDNCGYITYHLPFVQVTKWWLSTDHLPTSSRPRSYWMTLNRENPKVWGRVVSLMRLEEVILWCCYWMYVSYKLQT